MDNLNKVTIEFGMKINVNKTKLKWFGLLLFNGSTNRLYHATEIHCISRRAGNNTAIQLNSEIIE